MTNPNLHNPHLEGESFFWAGGQIGVLLVHGFTATTAEVRLLARILHHHGYTVAGPLLPGHYTQPEDLNRVSWQDWVEEVEVMYRQIKKQCEIVFVGGESTGAILALYLASFYPEVAAILAYAPAIRLRLRNFDILRLFLSSPFVPYIPKPNLNKDILWQGYRVNPLKGTIQLLRLQREVRSRLSSIEQPVLIVQGRMDATVHPEAPEMIAAAVRSTLVEIHWMEQSSHVVCVDCELEQVAEITLGFLGRVLNLSRTSQARKAG